MQIQLMQIQEIFIWEYNEKKASRFSLLEYY